MCGIAGLFTPAASMGGDRLRESVAAMIATLRHRGPDGEGIWTDEASAVALGHRRLSVVDLTATGAQPMTSADGRFAVTYNGEGYNAAELRADLAARGIAWRGHSDTEVLCEGFSAWGVEATVRRFNGMFAFAAWDTRERRLYLGRDRMGIKPLYWARANGGIAFASELKALRVLPKFDAAIDRDAVVQFLRFCYIPAPRTIYAAARKLEPGHILVAGTNGDIEDRVYWSAREVARAGVLSRRPMDETEAAERLEELLGDAVHRQMISDVPLGAFLSGGVDSSLVAALMRAKSNGTVRTFSIGFHEPGFNEAVHAAAVARHLGTEHTEFYVEPRHAIEAIPTMAEMYDEPFADSSQIPTYLLAGLTRRHVTVALSGDGGDELFGGYTRYVMHARLAGAMALMPASMRRALARGLDAVPGAFWDAAGRVLPARVCPSHLGDKARKAAEVLALDEKDLYRRLVSHWTDPAALVPGGRDPRDVPQWDEGLAGLFPDAVDRMQLIDTLTYLPDDILTKVDRATMAVSLEARVPLLDHRVVELVWSFPRAFRVKGGVGKRILRRILHRHVPPALVERPKMGFGVPIGAWLRGPLRDWAESLLAERSLAAGGLVDPAPVRRLWAEHLSGRRDGGYLLWDVLMLESWRARWTA